MSSSLGPFRKYQEGNEDGPKRFRLVGGPQDGAAVVVYSPEPIRVFVGRKWMGDGAASWAREKCDRFPVCYTLDMATDRYNFLEERPGP